MILNKEGRSKFSKYNYSHEFELPIDILHALDNMIVFKDQPSSSLNQEGSIYQSLI